MRTARARFPTAVAVRALSRVGARVRVRAVGGRGPTSSAGNAWARTSARPELPRRCPGPESARSDSSRAP